MSYFEVVKKLYDRVSLHEAAHCVCAIALNKRFSLVTIQPHDSLKDTHRAYVGGVEKSKDPYEDLLIDVAGYTAEKIYTNNAPIPLADGAYTDFENINRTIKRVYGQDQLMEMTEKIMDHARSILSEHWNKVEAIAKQLQKDKILYFSRVKEIYDNTKN